MYLSHDYQMLSQLKNTFAQFSDIKPPHSDYFVFLLTAFLDSLKSRVVFVNSSHSIEESTFISSPASAWFYLAHKAHKSDALEYKTIKTTSCYDVVSIKLCIQKILMATLTNCL
ncbi:CLUMA_CG018542, isoform A [Clunio marinus]|uniref:CLUMA_CG018542, isoform A n=1 Tax=Clunio marinus TaxID=568069 RepID=A0A1J1J3Z8_9DIPT|nr:CLUMA_CG018542, isoform A [Clunio marinus]